MNPSEGNGEPPDGLGDRTLPELRRLADQFTEQADHPRALSVLREVERRLPDHPAVLLDLVRVHHRLHDKRSIEESVGRLWKLLRGQAADLDLLGEELQELGSHELALKTFGLLRESPVPQVRAVGLSREAALQLRLGNRCEAELAGDEAFRLCPGIPESRSAKALLCQEHQPETALGLLVDLARPAHGVPPAFTVSCGHRLAAVYDKLDRPDEAIQALANANALEANHVPKIRELRAQRSAWMDWHHALADFDHAQAEFWKSQAPSSAAHAFLLGHPRSGTTLLEQILDANPAIGSVEETDHFADVVAKGLIRRHSGSGSFVDFVQTMNPAEADHLRSGYVLALERELGDESGRLLVLDKNPGLTIVTPLIARVLPHSKLIIALRDPRDVCLSAYFQATRRNAWSVNWLTLSETVAQYVFAMDLWLQTRVKLAQPWIEVRYEDVVRDPVSEGRRVTRFLGIEWHPSQADPAAHARGKFVKSPTHADVVRPVHRNATGRWRRYQKHLAPFQELLSPFIEAFGYEP